MSATPAPVVGVAGVPEVAAALREIGYTVVTGKTFREAAIAIAAQLKISPIHVVVEAMNEAGLKPWVVSTHGKSSGVILLATSDEVDLSGPLASIPQLPLPATVNDLLVMMDATPALAAAGDVRIEAHGVPAQAVPSPAVQESPPPVQGDSFTALMAGASGSVAGEAAVPAPAEVTDPFATPAVTDPFAGTAGELTEAGAPHVSDPFADLVSEIGVTDASPDEPAPALGVPNPIPEASPAVDPFAASAITGEELPEQDDFLLTVAKHAAVSSPAPSVVAEPAPESPVVPMPAPAAPAPVAVPVVAEPVAPAPAAVTPAVVEPAAPAPAAVIPMVPEPVAVIPVTPQPAAVIPTVPAPATHAVEQPTSEFIQQVLARRQVRPAAPIGQAQSGTPFTPQTPAAPAADFFPAPGISTGGCRVIVSTAGKGGAGKTTQASMYAQTAGDVGMRVLLIDANRDQGDIGTTLRIEKAGFPTVLQTVQGHPSDAIVSKDKINAARPAAAQDIQFDVVLAPPREYAGPRYASAQVYAKLLAYAKTRYELIVIDTQIVEAQKSDLHTGFIIPELRSGAWSAGIALYDYSAIRNAFAVFDELAALGVTPQRTLVVATRWPEREQETERFVSQFGQYGTFVGFVGDDPNINAQKSVGNLLIGSPAVAPVVRTLLYRVTNNAAFAPIEQTGRRRRRKDSPASAAKKERRGLFGGHR